MRCSHLSRSRRRLAQSAATVLVIGVLSGCSSDAIRFTYDEDGMFTGATTNQRQVIKPKQLFPGDAVAAAPALDAAPTGSVTRQAVQPVDLTPKPVTRTALPAPAAVSTPAPAPAPKPEAVASVQPKPAPAQPKDSTLAESEPAGWSSTGGTRITVREGETIYNLSRRYGVPADVLIKVNNLSGSGLKAGQEVLIPTYVYHRKAPVSAPDNDPKVANAKSSRGSNSDAPAKDQPIPLAEKVAVLPQSPRVKEAPASSSAVTAPKDEPAAAKTEVKNAPADGRTYTVQAGDTLSKIASKTGVTTAALKQENGLSDGIIRVGQKLRLPAAPATVAKAPPSAVDPTTTGSAVAPVKNADGGQIADYTPPKPTRQSIEEAEEETAVVAPGATGIGKMRWPVKGRVISGFGKGAGSSNGGIDIGVPEGTPVKAAENGVVIYAGDGLKDFGNTVLVRHEDGLVTVYGHAKELTVKRGDKVKRGQQIAVSGMSGTTDRPKLHFEVRKNSAPVDPMQFLE